MASVVAALRRVKADPARVLDGQLIEAACEQADHTWRDRKLGPAKTVHAMVLQALHANVPIGEVVRMHQGAFTGAAFCRARRRLPLQVMFALFHHQHRSAMRSVVRTADTAGMWRGHQVWLGDSTGFSMPDTPALSAQFGQPANQKAGCGFPVCRTYVLFDWRTEMLLDFVPAPLDTGEGALAPLTHPSLRCGDIVVADSNFGSFGQIALQWQRGLHAMCEVHNSRAVSFDPRRPAPGATVQRSLGRHDQLVRWHKPSERPAWMDQRTFDGLPKALVVRELRVSLRGTRGRKRDITLVTTLLDRVKYPAKSLAELYARRWRIEGSIRTLKHTLGLDVLRCKSWQGVIKELLAIVLVYNMVRMVMLQAAHAQGVAPDRISFADAMRWWRWAGADESVPVLNVNPSRPNRHEPRVRKRRAKAYPLMHQPRHKLKRRPKRPKPRRAK